jgi:hypothetical protein
MASTMVTDNSKRSSKNLALAGPGASVLALEWLQSLPEGEPYFSEREYCEAALEFANAHSVDDQHRAMLALCNDHQLSGALPKVQDKSREANTVAMERLRQWFIERLLRVTGNRSSGRRELAREVGPEGDRVLITERTHVTENEFRIARRVTSFSYTAALSRALLVLINPAYRVYGECLGDELCRCKLDGCEKFFFARHESKSGPPMRQYCCVEHRDEWRRLDGPNRARRSRDKKMKGRIPRNHK